MSAAAFQHTKYMLTRLILVISLGFVFFTASKSQEINYRAQSLFIYKFSKYIYWPEEKTKGDFLIGVYGNSPVFEELELMASIKKAGNEQDIIVRNISAEDSLAMYHIVYLSSSKSRQIKTIAEEIGNLPVLLLAEREGMANRGATISFLVTDDGRLKFEVNMKVLNEQQLRISEELLKIGIKL